VGGLYCVRFGLIPPLRCIDMRVPVAISPSLCSSPLDSSLVRRRYAIPNEPCWGGYAATARHNLASRLYPTWWDGSRADSATTVAACNHTRVWQCIGVQLTIGASATGRPTALAKVHFFSSNSVEMPCPLSHQADDVRGVQALNWTIAALEGAEPSRGSAQGEGMQKMGERPVTSI
jgi:hypothetical protein